MDIEHLSELIDDFATYNIAGYYTSIVDHFDRKELPREFVIDIQYYIRYGMTNKVNNLLWI